MVASHMPRDYVKSFGRWSSDAVDVYIEEGNAIEAAKWRTLCTHSLEATPDLCGFSVEQIRARMGQAGIPGPITRAK